MNGRDPTAEKSTARMLIGAAVTAGLVIALLLSLKMEPSDRTTRATIQLPNGLSGAEQSPPTSVRSAAVKNPTTLVSDESTVPVLDEDGIRRSVAAALGEWGRFAVVGNPDPLMKFFHSLSPQLPLLEETAAKITSDPLGEPSFVLEMADPAINYGASGFVSVQGPVTTTRADHVSESIWQLVLVWSEETSTWLVWTLEELN